MLVSRFGNLKMMKHETISNFNSKLCNIANEAFAFGEKYSDTACEENLEITTREVCIQSDTMKLDELMGSLQIFELNLKQNKKEKSITFQVEEQ